MGCVSTKQNGWASPPPYSELAKSPTYCRIFPHGYSITIGAGSNKLSCSLDDEVKLGDFFALCAGLPYDILQIMDGSGTRIYEGYMGPTGMTLNDIVKLTGRFEYGAGLTKIMYVIIGKYGHRRHMTIRVHMSSSGFKEVSRLVELLNRHRRSEAVSATYEFA